MRGKRGGGGAPGIHCLRMREQCIPGAVAVVAKWAGVCEVVAMWAGVCEVVAMWAECVKWWLCGQCGGYVHEMC